MDASNQSRKLAAILAADVAGYSRLMGDDENATVQTLTEYRRAFVEHIGRHHGKVVDAVGDSVLANFDSPVEAVECAVEIQRDLARRNRQLAEHRQMRFRIGINIGDVIARAAGTIFGEDVNIAARLESLAQMGGMKLCRCAARSQEGLGKGRRAITKQWAGRKEPIECVTGARLGMYDESQGIARKRFQKVEGSDFFELE